jgi:hypothetical protein
LAPLPWKRTPCKRVIFVAFKKIKKTGTSAFLPPINGEVSSRFSHEAFLLQIAGS